MDDLTSTDQLTQFKAWFRADREHSSKWREAAREDFKFLASEQWTEEEKADLKAQMRPVITFNRTHAIINSVGGMEINNRQEVKYFPREPGDAKPNELLTEGAKWFRDEANADDEDTDAFMDSTVCGMGWTETTLDYEEDPEGTPRMNAVNPLEMYWDRNARKKNLTDRQRQWRVRDIPVTVALEMFPGSSVAELDAKWTNVDRKDDAESQDIADRYEGESDKMIRDDKCVTVVHLQYRKRVPVYMIEGATREFDAAEFGQIKKRADAMGMPLAYSKRSASRIKNVFIGAKVLRETDAICKDHFSFQCVTAYQDKVGGTFFGLMKLMKDPQKWANKWMLQALQILNSNAKGGLMIEKGVTDNVRDLEKNWARTDKITVFEDGAITGGRIKEKPQANMPAPFFNMMQFAMDAVRDVPGVSLELLGQADRGQPASLEYQRRQSGMTILAPLFDNLKRYRRDQGKVMLYIIQNYLNDGRLVRIVGKEGAQYVPLALQQDVKYDIVVDDQVNSPDQKMMVWQMLTPFLGMLPPQVQLALVDFAPLPTSVIEKIKAASAEAAEAAAKAPNPEMMKMEAEAKKAEADTQLAMLEGVARERQLGTELQITQAKAQLEQAKAGTEQRRMVMEEEKMRIEKARFQLDAGEVEATLDLKYRELALKQEQARQQAMDNLLSHIEAMRKEQAEQRADAAKPRKIVRDGNNRAVGIQIGNAVKSLVRDEMGRVSGVN